MLPSQPPPKYESVTQPTKKVCNLELDTWFLIHSIIVTILNIPVLIVTARLHGLIVIPFAYNMILLQAAIWKSIPAIKVIKALAYVGLYLCVYLSIAVPSAIGFYYGTHYTPECSTFYWDYVSKAAFGSLLAEIPVVVAITFVTVQLHLAENILEMEKKRKNGNSSIRATHRV